MPDIKKKIATRKKLPDKRFFPPPRHLTPLLTHVKTKIATRKNWQIGRKKSVFPPQLLTPLFP